jgi:hypothetical protein
VSDLFVQNQNLIESDMLNTILDRFSFTFHGMLVRDVQQVRNIGFMTRPGKCNFCIDPGYVIRKYATLGENTRHYYSDSYRQDLKVTAKKFGIGNDGMLETRVKKIWAEASEYTALLVLSTENHSLRPGLGNKLYVDGTRILGGLSKWLHFHLTLLPKSYTSFWDNNHEELQKYFIYLQDKRYSRSHSSVFSNLKVKSSLLDPIQTPIVIPSANIFGFMKISNEIRLLVDKDSLLDKKNIIRTLSDYVCEKESWLYLNEAYEEKLPLLVMNMVNGLYWGRLVHELRKMILSLAVHAHYSLVKIDSPQDSWDVRFYSLAEIVDRINSLQDEEDLDDGYGRYKQLCLKNLTNGLTW